MWTASPEDQAGNPLLSMTAKLDPWTVNSNDILDSIDARLDKLKEGESLRRHLYYSSDFIIGPLAWLMKKEFFLQTTTHHFMLKVSPSFMGGLHN
jgi:hypothetical protein